jgi:DNA-binding CsgD family transcriptional regulator
LTAAAAGRIIPGAVNAGPAFGLRAALADLGTDLSAALQEIPVPAYLVDAQGRVLWANDQMRRLFGGPLPESAFDVVAPESRQLALEQQAVKRFTGKPTHFEATLLDAYKRRIPVEINSVPLRADLSFVGVFGLVTPPGELEPKPVPLHEPGLTPRQHDVLRLLGHGASTAQIAQTLGISKETARNHIRGLLKRLGQSSRVAAVAYARQHGLI